MSLTTDRPEDDPQFNITLQLVCSRKPQTLGEITRVAKTITNLKSLYDQSHVSADGRIHPDFVPNLSCRRFFLDVSDENNAVTAEKTAEVFSNQTKPSLRMTTFLEELINGHELAFVSESNGTGNDVTAERVRIGCEDGMLFHYFNSIRTPWNARKELTERAMPGARTG